MIFKNKMCFYDTKRVLLVSCTIAILIHISLFLLYYFFVFDLLYIKGRILMSVLVPLPIAWFISFAYYMFAIYICSPDNILIS